MEYLNKSLKEYTIKDIYNNLQEFQKEFPVIMDTNDYKKILEGNFNLERNFYAKLKFAQILDEYRKVLQIIKYETSNYPYDNVQDMINEILNSVENVKTTDMKEAVKYDLEAKEVIFNTGTFENVDYDKLMAKFTEITLNNRLNNIIEDQEGNLIKCSVLNKGYVDYISRKAITTRWIIRDHEEYEDIKSQTYEGKIFDQLVDLFGEEKILNINSENFEELSKDFNKYDVDITQFLKDLENTNNTTVSDNIKEVFKKNVDKSLQKIRAIKQAKMEDEKTPSKKAYWQIKSFEKMLNLCDDIPQDRKSKLLEKAAKNTKEFEYKETDKSVAGLYCSILRKVLINKATPENADAKYKNIMHELMHAATTERDEKGNIIGIGLEKVKDNKIYGRGLNEGATEYFAQKLYSKLRRQKVYVGYWENVGIINQLVELYGETTILDAMLDGTENLENLMAKDGKSYTQLRDLMDKYYENKYCDKNSAKGLQEIEEPLRDVQFILSEIKYNRASRKENIKYKVFAWFKDAKNRIKNIFNKQEGPLLLSPHITTLNQTADKEKQDLREFIKVDNSKLNNYNRNQQNQEKNKTEYGDNQNKEER